jgi:hypothetical protein
MAARVSNKQRTLYAEVAGHATAPIRARKAVVEGRGGVTRKVRLFHLSDEEVVTLRKRIEEGGRFISPYADGMYSLQIETLVLLGANEPHLMGAAFKKFKEIASRDETKNAMNRTLWDRFSQAVPRNMVTNRDPLGKFIYNYGILQRLGGVTPYGLKLAQLGAKIDLLEDSEGIKVMLATDIPEGSEIAPINMLRRRKYAKSVDHVPSCVTFSGMRTGGRGNQDG